MKERWVIPYHITSYHINCIAFKAVSHCPGLVFQAVITHPHCLIIIVILWARKWLIERQNHLKVGTDKPKLKVKMPSVSDDDIWKGLLEKPRLSW